MRGAFDPPGNDAPHLFELGHEVRLRVQATGRVHDRDVAAASARRLDGVECDGCRIGAT